VVCHDRYLGELAAADEASKARSFFPNDSSTSGRDGLEILLPLGFLVIVSICYRLFGGRVAALSAAVTLFVFMAVGIVSDGQEQLSLGGFLTLLALGILVALLSILTRLKSRNQPRVTQ